MVCEEQTLAGAEVSERPNGPERGQTRDRKSTRLNSSHSQISYAVFCLKQHNVSVDPLSLAVYDHQLYELERPACGAHNHYRFSCIEPVDAAVGATHYPVN